MQLNFIEKLPIIKFSFRIELTLGHLVFLTNSWKLWSQVSTGNISSRTNWCTCCFVFNYTSLNRNLNNTVGCFSMCSNTASNQMAAFEMWPRPPKRISEWSKYKSALHKHEFGRLVLNVQIYHLSNLDKSGCHLPRSRQQCARSKYDRDDQERGTLGKIWSRERGCDLPTRLQFLDFTVKFSDFSVIFLDFSLSTGC